jgi:hypothetical protein
LGNAFALSDTGATIGHASGLGAAAAIGQSTAAAIGNAAGVGVAAAVGGRTQAAVGNATGIGAAAAVGQQIINFQTGAGNAAGVGAAAAVGRSTAAARGNAAGIGTAAGDAGSQFIRVDRGQRTTPITSQARRRAQRAMAPRSARAGAASRPTHAMATGSEQGSGTRSVDGAMVAGLARQCCAIVASDHQRNKRRSICCATEFTSSPSMDRFGLCPWADILYSCDFVVVATQGRTRFQGLRLSHDLRACNEFGLHRVMIEKVGSNELLLDRPTYVGAGGNSGFQALNSGGSSARPASAC